VVPAAADLRDALGEVLSGAGLAAPVRVEIVESWRRVASRGLQPEHFDPTYNPDVEHGSLLERAALPVLDQLDDDLAGTETSLLLTDERGHVVDRRVENRALRARLDDILLAPGFLYDEGTTGTNGIGSALAERRPVVVRGGEHFADALTGMACAGAPVTDPRTGQILGIVDVTVCVSNANLLMLPFAKRAAWEIEQRLLDGASTIERVLRDRFLAARSRTKAPLALISEHTMMTNAAAARIVEPAEHFDLWESAQRMVAGNGRSRDVALAGGAVITDCEPVHDGRVLVGVLVRLRAGLSDQGAEATIASDRPTLGWRSLTASERGVAGFVAEGLTNRQLAARLFLSPHTVDAHLRHIFTKLDIHSRVELAGIVAAHK